MTSLVKLSITYECNMNCITCLLDTELFPYYTPDSLSEIADSVRNMPPNKSSTVIIGGGEPTLHENFLDILKFIKVVRPNVDIILFTNGIALSDKMFVKKIADINAKLYPCIAIHSHKEEVHDYITQLKGSFKKSLQAFRNLLEFGIPVEARIIVNKLNYRDLNTIAEFLVQELPLLERISFVSIKLTGNAYKNRNKLLVTYSQSVPFLQNAVEFLEKERKKIWLFHYPLCVLPRKLWKYAQIRSQAEDVTYTRACKLCKMMDRCELIWKSYLALVGDKEFHPILEVETNE